MECTPQTDQQAQDIRSYALAGFEGNMPSAMECISWSDQQTKSLGSKVLVMRLRGGAPKKCRRRAYFHGGSSQPINEMRVEIDSKSEKE
jgi:hypothetical protein